MSEVVEATRAGSTTADDTLTPGKSAVISIWVDPSEYAPGTKNQTMYK
ncbi:MULTISPECIES: hypothetical protein [Cupriavidus]|nr:hypothetical protein N234_30270 [Ralstonia pickettii DTP0602]